MEHIAGNFIDMMHQLLRLGQQLGIPVFVLVSLIGLLLILTAGKNPIRKKIGFLLVILFLGAAFAIAYVPSIAHTVTEGKSPTKAQYSSIKQAVDATEPIGAILFRALLYATIPVTVIMFYIGGAIRLVAGKMPGRKRMGYGLMIFSPATLGLVIFIPKLLVYL